MPRAWHLKSRPKAMPTRAEFELKPIDLPTLDDGAVHVRNRWLSVDPYMRGRMNDVKSYVAPFQLGEPLEGGAIGEVVESRADGFAPGDLVQHMAGWRDEAVLSSRSVHKLPDLGVEPQLFLGVLGVPGATAWFGLLDVTKAQAGETVFVSAAAGAVGSAVVQIARARDMKVIGSAGGPEKCDYVRSLGANEVLDYKSGPILKSLARAAPDGIDVYFDNVGGDHLDAALACARDHARFAICGMIGSYNDPEPPSLRFLMRVIAARTRIQGFLIIDYMQRMPEFYAGMAPLIASGAVTSRETVMEGLEATPQAFLGLFEGTNTGKMLVRL